MKRFFAKHLALISVGMLFALPMHSEEKRPMVVMELFTSEGCSSCPAADKIAVDLAQQEDILPLSLHVDYWDYLGWKDPHAQAFFTNRQKKYAHVAGTKTVYTPQAVIMGRDHVIGARRGELMDVIDQYRGNLSETPVAISYTEDGKNSILSFQKQGRLPSKMKLQLVRFIPKVVSHIGRGENAGRTVEYANVVTSIKVLKHWDGMSDLKIPVALEANEEAAVLVQADNYGAIIAAARLN